MNAVALHRGSMRAARCRETKKKEIRIQNHIAKIKLHSKSIRIQCMLPGAEIWDQATDKWTLLNAKHKVPRTYHSTAVLMPDGRVFTGGGGLCGKCKVNHLDAEIFNPPYLYNADGSKAKRPTISISTGKASNGARFTVAASEELMMVSMIRMGSATHSTNTDQRRIELCGPFTKACGGKAPTVMVHKDKGVALPGYWMVFGINKAGVPSEAETLLVG
jgi:galactose oxidase